MGVKPVSSVTIKDATEVTTYVLNTDYTLDAATGRFALTSGSAILDGATIHAGYTPTAGTKSRVSSGDTGSNTGAVRFIADNATGENRDCYIASASPGGQWRLAADHGRRHRQVRSGCRRERERQQHPQIIIDGALVV